MKSILIKDTTREEREEIVRKALYGSCGAECEFCSGCDNRGGGRIVKMSRKVQSGNAQNNGCVDRGKILKPNGAERNEASKSGGSYAAGIFCFSCNRRYTAGGHP